MVSKLPVLLALAVLVAESYAANYVICYYASWAVNRPGNGKFVPEDIDPNLCTHICYAFLGLNNDGTLAIMDQEVDINQGGYQRISDLKKINPNLKVLFSLGGAAADVGTFSAVAGNPALREAMGRSAVEFLQTYNFDGIDVDWEYPYDKVSYVALLSSLKDALSPHGYLVTVAVNSIPSEVGGYDIPGMNAVLDIINVMTYDFHAIWGGVTAENSPLYGGDSESDWAKENRNADGAIKQWIAGGADPGKVCIGVAFYGHSWNLADPNNHGMDAPTSAPTDGGPYTANVGSMGYNEVCEFHPQGTKVFLNDMRVPYLYDGSFWIGYDDEQSVSEKVQYAKEKGLAGVFIWSIETDDMKGFCGQPNGLLKAVNNAMRG